VVLDLTAEEKNEYQKLAQTWNEEGPDAKTKAR
jgi:hypothetical protein